MARTLLNARLDAAEIAAAVNGAELPAAIICNAHITGLAVTRSLAKQGVPVIAIDREPFGVALASNKAAAAAICSDPIANEAEFIEDIAAIGEQLTKKAVLFGCMDEWVLALSAHRERLEQWFVFPFADDETVRRILDKSVLYREAIAAGIPIPRSVDTRESGEDAALAEIGVPAVLKPAAKRPFYDAFGKNLFTPQTEQEFRRQRAQGERFGMIAQEVIPATGNDYVTVGAAIAPGGEVLGTFVGQRLEISPAGFGTTCLAKALDEPELEGHAVAILQRLGYYGIAEVEFLRDPRDGSFKLLDINTRPWKWVGLPVASGVDLPWLVYSQALGVQRTPVERRSDLTWVSVKDYVPLRASGQAMQPIDPIRQDQWLDLIAGRQGERIIDAILDPADPEPFLRTLQSVFGLQKYSCPC